MPPASAKRAWVMRAFLQNAHHPCPVLAEALD